MIKQTLNFYQFCDNWPGKDSSYHDQFSYNAKQAIFEYLEELSEDCGEDIEFDPIAICCEYNEESSAIDAASNYNEFTSEIVEDETEEEKEARALSFLQDNTTVLELENGGVVYIAF